MVEYPYLKTKETAGEATLAVTAYGSSPVKIRRQGTTYDVVLVELDDPLASRIHVQTSDGEKAFKYYVISGDTIDATRYFNESLDLPLTATRHMATSLDLPIDATRGPSFTTLTSGS